MILRGWHIDGFGQWHDHRVDELHAGLNVLHGPNEIGKTTLHAFVRGVLYGIPDGRSREPAYLPLRGGEHGGRLFLESGGRQLILSRHGRGKGRVSLEGAAGERLDPAELEALLRGVDGTIFRNVFAFGLDELASLDALQSEEVGLRIFDAGLEGAGRSVAAVVEELQKRREAELKSRSGRIRELAKELAAARRTLEQAVSAARGHGALAQGESDAAALLEKRRASLEAARRRLERWENLLSLWPVELRRRMARAALDGWGEVADGVLEAGLLSVRAEEGLQEDRRRRSEVLERSIEEERRELVLALASLGPGWTEGRLRALDRSAERRSAVGRHRAAIDEAERARLVAAGERDRLAGEAARLEAERAEMAAGIGQPEPGAVAGDAAGGAAAAEATAGLRGRRVALAELRTALALREETARRLSERRLEAVVPPRVIQGAWAAAALFALGALGAWAAGASVAALTAAGACIVLALGAWLLGRPPAAGPAGDHFQAAAADAERRIDAARASLGIAPPVTSAAVEACAFDLEDAERRLRHREEALRQLAGLQARQAGAAAALQGAEEALAMRVADVDRALAAWEHHAIDLGDDVSPADGLALLERTDRIVAMLDAVAGKETELADLGAAAERWDVAAAELLGRAGIEASGQAGLVLLGERLGYLRQANEAALQIAEQLGTDERGAALRAELERGERAHWLEASAAEREAIAALEAEVSGGVEALALRRREREELEQSTDVPARGAEVAAIEADFAAAVGRYREAALLERVLLQTLERFQQERQPEVLLHASEAFGRITAGRYVAVRQPAGAREVEVVDGSGRSIPAGALSRGTVEQLYICVRLGLVRAFAGRGLRLPLLLDDVFVNFDPGRADAAAAVLADFASEHQVLLFTCHPRTVERITDAAPACRVVALGGMGEGRADVA